jgi:hypothetical protein
MTHDPGRSRSASPGGCARGSGSRWTRRRRISGPSPCAHSRTPVAPRNRCGPTMVVREMPGSSSGQSFVPRFAPKPGLALYRQAAEDSRQRRCRGNRGHSQVAHLLVDADRPVIQPGLLQCGADPDRLLLDVLGDPVRARPGPSAARLKSRGLPLLERPSPDRVEGLPRRWRARGRTCSPRPAAHPVATARSRDGHEDQPGRSGPCLKHRGEVSPPKGPEAAPIY